MYVRMDVGMFVYIYMYMYMCIMHLFTYLPIYIHMHIYIYTYIYMLKHTYVFYVLCTVRTLYFLCTIRQGVSEGCNNYLWERTRKPSIKPGIIGQSQRRSCCFGALYEHEKLNTETKHAWILLGP